jgi:hypothetical protein
MSLRQRELRVGGTTAFVAVLGGALAILAVGLYIGPRVYLNRGGAPWLVILPTTFADWESRGPGEHFFLAFQTPEKLAAGQAYGHFPQPLLFLHYLCLQPFRWFGVSYARAQVWLCLPQLALILLLLGVHLRGRQPLPLWPARALPLLRCAVLMLAVAGVVTLPSFWVPFLRFSPETCLLPGLAFCYLAAADYRGTLRDRDAVWTLLPIALFAPIFSRSWSLRGSFCGVSARAKTSGSTGGPSADWPPLPCWGSSSSSCRSARLLRAGDGQRQRLPFSHRLDGSEMYFTSMAQALAWTRPVDRPCSYGNGRSRRSWRSRRRRPLARDRQRCPASLHLVGAILWLVIVVPQFVSIHPRH